MNFELLQSQLIPISNLINNLGQIPDVPKNPRFIKDTRFEKLVKSLQDNPEMLSARELLVYQHENQNIVIGGNMRLRAAKELGYKELPCKVLTDLTSEQIRAIVIKDNVSFGSDDFESLSNEWDSLELEEWGMDIPNIGVELDSNEFGENFTLPDGDKAPFQQMTFTLADEQAEQIKNAIADIKQTIEYKYCETLGNENTNGNALYLIIMQWAEQRK
jgi:hypothetical protein